MAWSQFRQALFSSSGGDDRTEQAERRPAEAAPLPARPAEPRPAARSRPAEDRRPSLDSIGQRNETVRLRIGEMVDRLEDLKSLQDDFSSILEPLVAITDELPRASMRIAELEALYTQEQQAAGGARREASELTSRIAAAGNDLSEAINRGNRLEAALRDRDTRIEELRIALRDRTLVAENLERQLYAETEQGKALAGENKALRIEAQAADQALARAEHDLGETRERANLFDQESRRLDLLSEERRVKLLDLEARYAEIEQVAEAERHRLRALETQLMAETATREKNEGQYEAEIGAHRTERASLVMKLEAMTNRATSTEQLLAQVRNQLREKDESNRIAERNFKEASIERVTVERRLESAQTDLARQTERFLEMQRLRSELDTRCDMLTKAMAAKDAAIEQATTRTAALSDRIDQMSRRNEAERAELDAANRRLIEELQNERSERVLAQGALDIARESRLALQKQHEALKRSARGVRVADAQEHAVTVEEPVRGEPAEPDSNVRPFTASGKSGERQTPPTRAE